MRNQSTAWLLGMTSLLRRIARIVWGRLILWGGRILSRGLRNILLGGISWALSSAGTPAEAAPRVVVSIAPLHSLVANVMQGAGQAQLLLPPQRSPHDFSLTPSSARMLQEADLIFLVSPWFETFLASSLRSVPRRVLVVKMIEQPGLHRLPLSSGGPWMAEEHAQAHKSGEAPQEASQDEAVHERKDAHGAMSEVLRPGSPARMDAEHMGTSSAVDPVVDPAMDPVWNTERLDGHVWLDPRNAQAMVRAIVSALSAMDPVQGAHYRANAARLIERLEDLDQRSAQRLSRLAAEKYIVFHDAYAYLEHRYGLHAAGVVMSTGATPIGPRGLAALRATIRTHHVRCLFHEPQFSPRMAEALQDGFAQLRLELLDPLGSAFQPGKELYFQVLEDLVQRLASCLE